MSQCEAAGSKDGQGQLQMEHSHATAGRHSYRRLKRDLWIKLLCSKRIRQHPCAT